MFRQRVESTLPTNDIAVTISLMLNVSRKKFLRIQLLPIMNGIMLWLILPCFETPQGIRNDTNFVGGMVPLLYYLPLAGTAILGTPQVILFSPIGCLVIRMVHGTSATGT